MEALEKMADGNATTIYLPFEASGLMSSVGGVSQLFKDMKS